VIIEPKDAKSLIHQERISPRVTLGMFFFEMLPTINFDDELCIATDEINNIWAYRSLTTKARPAHPMGAQCGPYAPLGIGRITPQRSRAVALFGRDAPVRRLREISHDGSRVAAPSPPLPRTRGREQTVRIAPVWPRS